MTKARENSDYTGLAADLAGLQTNITAGDTAARAGRKNLIINGGMVIDQRNSGAVTANTIGGYTLDRWTVHQTANGKFTVQQNSGSVASLADTGHANYFGVVSASAHSVTAAQQYLVRQFVEGFDFAHAGWGTSSAKTVTISFWVRSSLTGNHGGALQNSNATRVYPFSYVINVANTWEKKTITVAGDTTGTWIGATNGQGVKLCFSMGTGSTYSATAGAWNATQYVTSATGAVSIVGTSGATWYVTGVQLELGSVATDFEHRSYGEELALCERYYEIVKAAGAWSWSSSSGVRIYGQFRTEKRASPSVSGSPIFIGNGDSGYTQSSFAGPSTNSYGFNGYCYNFTSLPTTRSYTVYSTMNFDAEL